MEKENPTPERNGENSLSSVGAAAIGGVSVSEAPSDIPGEPETGRRPEIKLAPIHRAELENISLGYSVTER